MTDEEVDDEIRGILGIDFIGPEKDDDNGDNI